MRLPDSSLFLSLLFLLPGVSGREPVLYRVARSTLSPILDTCAYVEVPLSDILNSITGANSSNSSGEDLVQQCLCTSMIKSFLRSSRLVNIDTTDSERAFEEYVVESHNAQHCVYPPHSVAHCSRDDPCGLQCTDGFQLTSFSQRGRKANTCTCVPPNTICGGQCGEFPLGCPSATAELNDAFVQNSKQTIRPHHSPLLRPFLRPSAASHSYAAAPTGSFSKTQTQGAHDSGCSAHESLCGAYAPHGRHTMECVDTRRSLESCGGCVIPPPSPFYSFEYNNGKPGPGVGVDCSTLEGVVDVSCSDGRCAVRTCEIGWTVAHSGENCDPNTSRNAAGTSATGNGTLANARYAHARMPLLRPTSTIPSSTTTDSATSTSTQTTLLRSIVAPPSSSSTSHDPAAAPEGSAHFPNARTSMNLGSDRGLVSGFSHGGNEVGANSFGSRPVDPATLGSSVPSVDAISGSNMADVTGATDAHAHLATGVPDVNDIPAGMPRLPSSRFNVVHGVHVTGVGAAESDALGDGSGVDTGFDATSGGRLTFGRRLVRTVTDTASGKNSDGNSSHVSALAGTATDNASEVHNAPTSAMHSAPAAVLAMAGAAGTTLSDTSRTAAGPSHQ